MDQGNLTEDKNYQAWMNRKYDNNNIQYVTVAVSWNLSHNANLKPIDK